MSGDFLKDTIQTIIFLLPVLTLVWKGAKMSSKIEQLELTVKEKTEKFCRDHTDMKKEIEEEERNRRADIGEVMTTLNEIQKAIVRIEVHLKIDEDK